MQAVPTRDFVALAAESCDSTEAMHNKVTLPCLLSTLRRREENHQLSACIPTLRGNVLFTSVDGCQLEESISGKVGMY